MTKVVKTMTHTSGPWEIFWKNIWSEEESYLETEENAQLITTAPKMLRALKLAREQLYYAEADLPSTRGTSLVPYLDEVIAEAKGEKL